MNGWDAKNCEHLTTLERRLTAWWMKVAPTSIQGPPVATIVGEMPGKNTKSHLPMFPYPPNSAGGRLMKLTGFTPGQYLGRFARVDLISEYSEEWDAEKAKINADMLKGLFPPNHRVILCGVKVAKAFGAYRYFERFTEPETEVTYIVIPHPSGRNPLYSDVNARVATRAAMQFAGRMLKGND